MFIVNPNPTFNLDVKIQVAGAEPGEVNFTFKYLNAEELKEWRVKYGHENIAEGLKEIIADWKGPKSLDGKLISYSFDQLKILLISYPSAASDITQEFLREVLGARRKN
jgi:hypothetical protein